MKKLMNAAAVSLLMVMLLTLNVSADLILTPGDDTFTDLNDQNTNKDDAMLVVDYSGMPCKVTRRAYLRFDISPIYKDVGSGTTLRLYVKTASAFAGTLALWSTDDDWNGAGAGNGDETTLTWNNAPAPIAKLDTQSAGAVGSWVVFTGSDLRNFINSQRSANDGDNVASFIVEWDGCPQLFDSITFEDRENIGGTGNTPQLYPLGPNAITLSNLRATSASAGWPVWAGLGLLTVATFGLSLYRRRTRMR